MHITLIINVHILFDDENDLQSMRKISVYLIPQ